MILFIVKYILKLYLIQIERIIFKLCDKNIYTYINFVYIQKEKNVNKNKHNIIR